MSELQSVIDVIEEFFKIGKTKEFCKLSKIMLDAPEFSSFGDAPPYELQDLKTTVALAELKFASISDYDYTIINPKISIFENFAVAAFELVQKGMIVDNKSFTGEHITIHDRATFVLIKKPDWKIVHIHLCRI